MSSRKKTTKKSEVEKEDKKPPVLESPRKEEYQEITPEQEKALYQGQEHIEENLHDQSIQSNIVVTEMDNNTQKKEIITKPRETYLQEKMSKLNCNRNLMTNIKKELNGQIKTMVEEDNVLITEVPRDLNRYIKKNSEAKNMKNMSVDFSSKLKYKQLKVLKDEENILKNNLKQVEQNEKLLKDEGFINLNSSTKGYAQDSMFDKAIKEQQLKEVQQKKNKIINKIKDIEIKIMNIISDDHLLSNREKRKVFLDNFERDKEIAEIRAKKYLKESKEREFRMKNDINQLMEKRQKEIEEKDKKDQKKKEEIIKKFKEKEKAIELKHSKQNIDIMEKYKQFRDKNLEKKGKDYRYSKIYEKFLKNEEKVYKEASEKRHKLFNSAKISEIKEFTKKVDEKKEKDEQEREQKKMEIKEKWKKIKDNLPKCNFIPTNEDEFISLSENEKIKKKEENKVRNIEKKNYGEMIREKHAPEIDENLKNQREKIIFSLEEPKKCQVKYTMNKQKKKRVILKKRDNSKPSKFKWELKIEDSSIDKLEEMNKNLIKKPKKVNLSPISRTKSLIPEKRPDYLREIINKKKEKNRSMSQSEIRNEGEEELNAKKNKKKWEEAINNDKGNLIQNIYSIKEKANNLEKKAEMNEKLLHLNGGIENNPELGKKVSSLLIDSIEAKLSILKKVNDA